MARHYQAPKCESLEHYEQEIKHIAHISNENSHQSRLDKLDAANPELAEELAVVAKQRAVEWTAKLDAFLRSQPSYDEYMALPESER